MQNSRLVMALIAFAEKRLVQAFSAGLLVFFFIIFYRFVGGDFDIWFHLAYGKYFVTNLTWSINHAMFSWTPANPDWAYVTWMGSSVLYIVYSIGGLPALMGLQYGIFLLICLCYYLFLRQTNASFDIFHSTCVLLTIVALSGVFIIIKPEMFTTLFFAISVFLYITVKTTGHHRLLYWYPALFLIWVNTHGGFIFGLFLLFSLIVLEAVNQRFVKKALLTPAAFRALLLSALCSLVLLLVNPLGINYFIQLARDLFLNEYMDYAKELLAYVNLWKYILPERFVIRFMYSGIAMLLMLLTLTGLAVAAYRKSRFLDIPLYTVNLFFFVAGMTIARMTIFFPLLWLFTVPYIIYQAHLADIRRQLLPLALLIFIGFGGSGAYHCASYAESPYWFSPQSDEWYPADEAAYIRSHALPAPIFNDYAVGSYMLWALYPDYKVFIDTRYGPYDPQVRKDWFTIRKQMASGDVSAFLHKYPAKTAFVHLGEPYIINWLLTSRQWSMVYFGKVAAVLVHTSVIEERGYQAFAANLSADRFKNESNPVILNRLFHVYKLYYPQGHDHNTEMKKIYGFYKKNVSGFYVMKDIDMHQMSKDIETDRIIRQALKKSGGQ